MRPQNPKTLLIVDMRGSQFLVIGVDPSFCKSAVQDPGRRREFCWIASVKLCYVPKHPYGQHKKIH